MSKKKKREEPKTIPQRPADADYFYPFVSYQFKHLKSDDVLSYLPIKMEEGPCIIRGRKITFGDFTFHADDIQWYGRYKKSNLINIDVKINEVWLQLHVLPQGDEENFHEHIRKRLPDYLNRSRYINRPEIRTYTGTPAHITNQNIHGVFEKHQAVDLHITPLWMVVEHEGKIIQQHFIDDIQDIRCGLHPTAVKAHFLGKDVLLATFEVKDTAYAYALTDSTFAQRLSDAGREGLDTRATRKKKKE